MAAVKAGKSFGDRWGRDACIYDVDVGDQPPPRPRLRRRAGANSNAFGESGTVASSDAIDRAAAIRGGFYPAGEQEARWSMSGYSAVIEFQCVSQNSSAELFRGCRPVAA